MQTVMAAVVAGVGVPLVLLVVGLQLAAWIVEYSRTLIAFVGPLHAVAELTLSSLLAITGLHLVHQLVPRGAVGTALKVSVVGTYLLLTATTLTLSRPPDYGVIAEHAWLLRYPSSFLVLAGAMQIRVGLSAFVAFAGILIAERRFGILSRGWPRRTSVRAALIAAGYLGILACAWAGPVRTHDATSRFLLSALNYHLLPAAAGAALRERPGATIRPFVSTYSDARQTHVFFVLMESFNGLWLDRTTVDGVAITPVLNRVRSEGVSVEHFYANSIHTTRGFAASLCSVLPSLQRPIL